MQESFVAFKEFKYLNSNTINLDVRSRTLMLYFISKLVNISLFVIRVGIFLCIQYQMAVCRLELPREIVADYSKFSTELFLTAHIFSNQMAMHDVSLRLAPLVIVLLATYMICLTSFCCYSARIMRSLIL